MLTYLRTLTFDLRRRGLGEGRIAEAVDDVRSACRLTDRDPAELFGDAADHARTFPRGNTLPTGLRFTRFGLAGALVLAMFTVVAGPSAAGFAPAVVVAFLAVHLGRVLDRKLP